MPQHQVVILREPREEKGELFLNWRKGYKLCAKIESAREPQEKSLWSSFVLTPCADEVSHSHPEGLSFSDWRMEIISFSCHLQGRYWVRAAFENCEAQGRSFHWKGLLGWLPEQGRTSGGPCFIWLYGGLWRSCV